MLLMDTTISGSVPSEPDVVIGCGLPLTVCLECVDPSMNVLGFGTGVVVPASLMVDYRCSCRIGCPASGMGVTGRPLSRGAERTHELSTIGAVGEEASASRASDIGTNNSSPGGPCTIA